MKTRLLLTTMLITSLCSAPLLAEGNKVPAEFPVEHFFKKEQFRLMKISPTGQYLAATFWVSEEAEGLAIIDRKSMKVTANLKFRNNETVDDFFWVNNERVVISNAKRFGGRDKPNPTGELYAVSADGSKGRNIFGYQSLNPEFAWATVLDTLKGNDKEILITYHPFTDNPNGTFAKVMKLDVYSGRLKPVARAPMRQMEFLTDRDGTLRYGIGATPDGKTRLYERKGEEWIKGMEFAEDEEGMTPVAFDADNRRILATADLNGGPKALFRLDPQSNTQELIASDPVSDLNFVMQAPDNGEIISAEFYPDKPSVQFISPEHRLARFYRALLKAFPEHHVRVTSITDDSKQAVIYVYSDKEPGVFYQVDIDTKKVEEIATVARWIDPAMMAEMKPIRLKARDGLELHGYLTLPKGREPKNLPMIVLPHGGPHGPRDYWRFDNEAQLLANRGYAVLQINFRGSGGYGGRFQQAGYRKWGREMQDDVTDATLWAVKEGYADKNRMCIYGASYGGYAALMGAVREPALYRCAVSYVGVADLPMMYTKGDIEDSTFGVNYLKKVLGDNEAELKANSPTELAAKITVPVFLAYGGKDERVPQAQGEAMLEALEDLGKPVEWLDKPREGHGFYKLENQVEYYNKLLAFFAKNLSPVTQTAGR